MYTNNSFWEACQILHFFIFLKFCCHINENSPSYSTLIRKTLSTPLYSFCLRYILILFSHLCVGLSSGLWLFALTFYLNISPTDTFCVSFPSHHPNNNKLRVQIMRHLIYVHSSCSSCLVDPDIPFSTLFSNTLKSVYFP